MRAVDLLKKYRKGINPPYNSNRVLIISSTLLILVTIPLTAFLAIQGVRLKSQAAGFTFLKGTFKSISVYAPYSLGTLNLEYKKANSDSWLPAHEPYVDGASEIRGSIVGLDQNSLYDVRLTVGSTTYTGTVSTKNEQIDTGSRNTYYVSTTGNDSNPGTSSQPFRTIQKAANTVNAGDTVKISAGTYNETIITPSSGSANNYITFTNAGDGEVVIDRQGASGNIITINGKNYININGLTIKNAGDNNIRIVGSDRVVIEGNKIIEPAYQKTTGCCYGAIYLKDSTKNIVIRNNTFIRNTPQPSGSKFQARAVYIDNAGEGAIIYNNNITGGFEDGIGSTPESSSGKTRDMDIYDNYIEGCWDDGIQIEGPNFNVRVWGNEIKRCMIGIAMAPNTDGPLYVFRNVIYENIAGWAGGKGMFKLGDNTTGRAYFYHNSLYVGSSGDGYKQTNTGLSNLVSKNNSIYSGRYVMEASTITTPYDFDYDLMYTLDSSRFVKWSGSTTYGDIGEFRLATGQETHGIEADPKYKNPSGGDLTLQSEAPGIDKGITIANFNDANSAWPKAGSAPDVGAFESSGTAPPKQGDLNSDGKVDIFDASILASRWGISDPDADLNGNGVVDIFDASIMASNWDG